MVRLRDLATGVAASAFLAVITPVLFYQRYTGEGAVGTAARTLSPRTLQTANRIAPERTPKPSQDSSYPAVFSQPVSEQKQDTNALLQDESETLPEACRLRYMNHDVHQTRLSPLVEGYVRENVSFAVITGSGDNFFRADLALCTWLHHVPDSSLFFFSDKAGTSTRRGHWVEDKLPDGVTFTGEQVEAKGYTLSWIKAQFRFLFGLDYIIREDRKLATQKRWFLLIDDDTFVNLDGLVTRLLELDGQGSRGGGRYLADKGWGGAGHFFDRHASDTLLAKMRTKCIDPYMVRSFHASDNTLVKCAPQMNLKLSTEPYMSHCQACKVRENMLTGRHVTMHVKRDVAKPPLLAAWRIRLYYQVMYQRNITAYKLLMKVGSCAYGTCKHPSCDEMHDKAAMEVFLEVSNNNTVMPYL